MYFSTTPDCLTPSAAVGSSRIEHPGAEVDGPGDGHALALAAGERADGLVDVAQVDAHLRQLAARGLASSSRRRAANGPTPLVSSEPRKKLRHTGISGTTARSW